MSSTRRCSAGGSAASASSTVRRPSLRWTSLWYARVHHAQPATRPRRGRSRHGARAPWPRAGRRPRARAAPRGEPGCAGRRGRHWSRSSTQVSEDSVRNSRISTRVASSSGRTNGAARGRDPAEPVRSAAAEQAEQHGLGLVVAGVPEADEVGTERQPAPLERLVAGRARRVLGGAPIGPLQTRHLDPLDVDRAPRALAERPAETLVGLGRVAPELVVDVNEPGEPEAEVGFEREQHPPEPDRIRPARHRGGHAGPRRQQAKAFDERRDARGERGQGG